MLAYQNRCALNDLDRRAPAAMPFRSRLPPRGLSRRERRRTPAWHNLYNYLNIIQIEVWPSEKSPEVNRFQAKTPRRGRGLRTGSFLPVFKRAVLFYQHGERHQRPDRHQVEGQQIGLTERQCLEKPVRLVD